METDQRANTQAVPSQPSNKREYLGAVSFPNDQRRAKMLILMLSRSRYTPENATRKLS
jgi:hypothetical protein